MKIRDRIKSLRRVKAGDLLPNPRNWRKHSDAQRSALQGILAEVGYVDALIARETPEGLQLIDGHLRAETTPDTKVPVLIVDLTDEEAAIVLATFDPLSAMAETDATALDELLRDVETGSEALQEMLAELAEDAGLYPDDEPSDVDAEPQIDRAEELRKAWGVESGQLWILGEHRLLCGDSTKAEDVARVMDGEEVECVVTDPPYGIGVDSAMSKKGGEQYGNAAAKKKHYAQTDWDVLPPDSLINSLSKVRQAIIFGGNYFNLPPSRCWLVWDKENGSNNFSDCELAWSNLDAPVRLKRHMWNGMIRKGREERGSHPTQKPVGVMAWCIGMTEGDVYEPFSGSGTTIIAAEQLNRRCRAIEISPAYVAVAIQRWADATGKTPELAEEMATA